MIELIICEKIYGEKPTLKLELFGREVMRHIEELEIELVEFQLQDHWVKVMIEGEDEGIAANFIRRVYGEVRSMKDVSQGEVLKGFAKDVGKVGYGLYLDAFIEEKDALIPLYSLRNSLVEGKKLPLRRILREFGIVENMPLEFVVRKKEEGKIEGFLSEPQVEEFMELMERGLDSLVVAGATRKQVKAALRRSGHLRDILRVESYSFLCHRLICKEGTDAVGLIPEIGPYLVGSEFGVFSPKRVKETLRSKG